MLANILETPPDDLQYVKSLYSSSSADLTSPSLSFDHILAMGGCKRKQITPTPSNVSSNVNGGGAYSTGYRRRIVVVEAGVLIERLKFSDTEVAC